jgi:uncharacterized protein YuzE/antitoxin (DNA-binding transcriptional repressor) of toxin-antitoxin stability system
MKVDYHPETDSLYLDLSERPSAKSREISEGVVLDYDDAGNLVGIGIDNASAKVQLEKLVVSGLPATVVKKGRTIDVTAHGRPTPRLVPVRAADRRQQLAARGRLVLGHGDLLDLGTPLRPRRGTPVPGDMLGRARAHER